MDRHESAAAGLAHTGYRFGEFRLDAGGTLLHGETHVLLSEQELAALLLLLAHPGRIITLLDFKQALYGDAPVAIDIVSKCVASLRKKLEPEGCIESVFRRGYRMAVAVRPLHETSAALPRIAILPFQVAFGVPEYLGPVIAEEVGAQLIGATQPIASVVAKDSVIALTRRGLSPRQIGEMLQADLVLSGTLRAMPTHYRMRVEMIRVADGSQDWVEDLLVERDRVAGPAAILTQILTQRIGSGGLSIAASADQSPRQEEEPNEQHREAYELFQRARYEWQSLERHRMQDALRHLERAVELDPSLIEARTDLVHLCMTQVIFGFMAPAIAAELAGRIATAVPGFISRAESVLPSVGWFAFHADRDLPTARTLFRRSAHLPHDAWVTRARVHFALSRHRFAEAAEIVHAAIRVDPFSPPLQARLAWTLHLDGQASASVDLIRTVLKEFPENESAEFHAINILGFNGESNRALEIARGLTRRLPYFDLATSAHAYALAIAGHSDEARVVLDRLQWLSRERYVLKTMTAFAYMALGEEDLAIAELRAADERRCPWFLQVLADPRLKPLRGRPAFDAMLNLIPAMEAQAESDAETDAD